MTRTTRTPWPSASWMVCSVMPAAMLITRCRSVTCGASACSTSGNACGCGRAGGAQARSVCAALGPSVVQQPRCAHAPVTGGTAPVASQAGATHPSAAQPVDSTALLQKAPPPAQPHPLHPRTCSPPSHLGAQHNNVAERRHLLRAAVGGVAVDGADAQRRQRALPLPLPDGAADAAGAADLGLRAWHAGGASGVGRAGWGDRRDAVTAPGCGPWPCRARRAAGRCSGQAHAPAACSCWQAGRQSPPNVSTAHPQEAADQRLAHLPSADEPNLLRNGLERRLAAGASCCCCRRRRRRRVVGCAGDDAGCLLPRLRGCRCGAGRAEAVAAVASRCASQGSWADRAVDRACDFAKNAQTQGRGTSTRCMQEAARIGRWPTCMAWRQTPGAAANAGSQAWPMRLPLAPPDAAAGIHLALPWVTARGARAPRLALPTASRLVRRP